MNQKEMYFKKSMFFLFIGIGILLLLFSINWITKDALLIRCVFLSSGVFLLMFTPEQVFVKIKSYIQYENLLDMELTTRAPILKFEFPSYFLLGISLLIYCVFPMNTIAIFSITLNSFICLPFASGSAAHGRLE